MNEFDNVESYNKSPNVRNRVNATIEEIHQGISQDEHLRNKSNLSLLTGESGIALFYSHLYIYTQDEQYHQIVFSLLKNIYQQIDAQGIRSLNFGYGFTGIGWLVHHLKNLNLLQRSEILDFNKLDKQIAFAMLEQGKIGYLDYFSGALGYTLFFIQELNKSRIRYLEKLVIEISKRKINILNSYAWLEFNPAVGTQSTTTVNLGIAHGMPSILSVLLQLYRKGIMPHLCEEMIIGGINFFLETGIFDDPEKGSIFPSAFNIHEQNEKLSRQSRLAWCYGDLSILHLLIEIDNTFKLPAVKSVIAKMIIFECKRTNLEKNLVVDSGLCHGAAGVLHLFRRIKQKLSCDSKWLIPQLDLTIAYWTDLTLTKFKDNTGKYLTLDSTKNGYTTTYGLLEGMSGVGLVLLSMLLDTEKLKWDKVLLLE